MAKQTGPTLSEVTQLGRQTVKIVIAGLVLMMVGRMVWGAFSTYWQSINPPPPPPPTVGFGILPAQRFPERTDLAKPANYQLEIAAGRLPNLGDRATVFFMPTSTLGLFADQDARELAARYNFVFEPERLSARLYRWRRSSPLESTLQIDIQTLQMRFTTNFLNRPDLLVDSRPPERFEAEQVVKSFLRTGNLLAPDLADSTSRTTYLRLEGTELVEAVSYTDADFVEVNLNRAPIDDLYEIFTPEGFRGVVRAIVGGAFSGNSNVYQLTYNYQEVDYLSAHTYPLRSTADAWNVLKAGEGFLADFDGDDTAVIREVVLGYYDDFEEQQFLMPIYVFLGDDNFIGYVSAIDPSFINSDLN